MSYSFMPYILGADREILNHLHQSGVPPPCAHGVDPADQQLGDGRIKPSVATIGALRLRCTLAGAASSAGLPFLTATRVVPLSFLTARAGPNQRA